MSVNEFVAWALSHAKRASVPNGAVLCVDPQNVGRDGEWEYLYGTTGRRVTQSLLDERYANYYSRKGWTRAEYDRATSGWIERGVTVCDCQGLEDYYSGSDTNCQATGTGIVLIRAVSPTLPAHTSSARRYLCATAPAL